MSTRKAFFRPRARLLLLLGDQLIRDPGVAVFELVKNAFDADSPGVTVTMSRVEDPARGQIIVEDSGVGMDADTVSGVWLEPGTDHRIRERKKGSRRQSTSAFPLEKRGSADLPRTSWATRSGS